MARANQVLVDCASTISWRSQRRLGHSSPSLPASTPVAGRVWSILNTDIADHSQVRACGDAFARYAGVAPSKLEAVIAAGSVVLRLTIDSSVDGQAKARKLLHDYQTGVLKVLKTDSGTYDVVKVCATRDECRLKEPTASPSIAPTTAPSDPPTQSPTRTPTEWKKCETKYSSAYGGNGGGAVNSYCRQ